MKAETFPGFESLTLRAACVGTSMNPRPGDWNTRALFVVALVVYHIG